MSKISRALITVLFAGLFLPAASSVAHAANTVVNCGTSGSYTVNETGVVVSSSSCVGTVTFGANVTSIPDKVDGQGIFQNNDSLTAVTFGPTVKSIGTYAFKGASLESIVFSEGLETIAANSFYDLNNTTQLDNVDLIFPDSLKYIGTGAFQQGTPINGLYGKLGAVSFGPNLEYLGANAFYNIGKTGATSVTFREDPKITTFQDNIFYGIRATEFVFPSNLTTLGGNQFYGATQLTYALLPEGLTTTNLRSFGLSGTSALRVVFLPDNITTLDQQTFQSQSSSTLKFVYCGTNPTMVNTVTNDTYLKNFKNSTCYRAIQYNANKGAGATVLETATPNSSKTLRLNTYTRNGYEFDGWNTKRDGSGTSYSDGQTFAINAHLTLFAQWWDLSKPRPNKDNSDEVRRKRQAEIEAARNSLVQKIKAGETVGNPDLIAADVQQFNAEIAKKANADFQVAAKSEDFGFPDVRTVINKWSIYQDIENGVRSTVTGRTASAAGIIPEGVVQKQLLISRVQKVAPEKRATVEQIDKLIADLAKVDAARKARLEEVTKRRSN